MISSSGSKFDVRQLKDHSLNIDQQGYLRVDNNRVVFSAAEKGFLVIKAENLRSYTIIRVLAEDGRIQFFDDYDLVRRDNEKMFIDIGKAHQLVVNLFCKDSAEDAKTFPGEYVFLWRDNFTAEEKKHLSEILKTYQIP